MQSESGCQSKSTFSNVLALSMAPTFSLLDNCSLPFSQYIARQIPSFSWLKRAEKQLCLAVLAVGSNLWKKILQTKKTKTLEQKRKGT